MHLWLRRAYYVRMHNINFPAGRGEDFFLHFYFIHDEIFSIFVPLFFRFNENLIFCEGII